MGLIGREIVQTRVWDEKNIPPPHLNHKETFPITVFKAVRESMADPNSPNLEEMLVKIFQELANKQPIFAARPANYLMTFAGTPGAVGAIRISKEIPWDPNQRSHDKIPTEKAVGDLLYKLGLMDSDGNIIESDGRVRWSDVVGRPAIYSEEGDNSGGVMTQKAVTDSLNGIRGSITDRNDQIENRFILITQRIDAHTQNRENPHAVNINQIGAVGMEAFEAHINNQNNPHGVTKAQINLGHVDNTSDADKPISNLTQAALDLINKTLRDFMDESKEDNFIKGGSYNRASGQLTLTHKDGQTTVLSIPIDGLVYQGGYDEATKDFLLTKLSGGVQRVRLDDLYIRYLGSVGADITIEIDGDQKTGNQIIRATLNSDSITGDFFAADNIPERAYKTGSVSTRALGDLQVTTIKLADESVTTEKLKELSVTTTRIADRAVNGRTLFSAGHNNRILATVDQGSDPIWTLINEEMMGPGSVNTQALMTEAVSSSKLKDNAVINSKLFDLSVDTRVLDSLAVTNEKIANRTIQGTKLVDDILLPGTPRLGTRPDASSNTTQLPDTRWVKDRLWDSTFRNENLSNRIVNGRTLFSSNTNNRVLIVGMRETDPEWGQINEEMMGDRSVGSRSMINYAILPDAIADSSLIQRHFSNKSVSRSAIDDDAISSQQLFKSPTAHRVLGVTTENTNPVYTQITRGMLGNSIVDSSKIEDGSVMPRKLESDENGFVIMSVQSPNSDPVWVKLRTQMIADRQINGRVLFTSPETNRILSVTPENGADPSWTQVNGEMIRQREIDRLHIKEEALKTEHFTDQTIEGRHLKDRTIGAGHIASRAIGGVELFTSAQPERVLAVGGTPYSDPKFMQVTRGMIEDEAVDNNKLYRSELPYRILGATNAKAPPEYLRITHNFIVDDTITPQKLQHDFVLFGTPESTVRPAPGAKNRQLPDTWWVHDTITERIRDFNPTILFDTIDSSMIKEKSIEPKHLFSSPVGMRLLGVTAPGMDLEFLMVEEQMIVNGSITNDKLGRDLVLWGSPRAEVRPSPNAGDYTEGNGNLIPDVQWVRDRIKEASLSPGDPSAPPITSVVPNDNSITRAMLMDRIVNGPKLFSSTVANRVLTVLAPNSDPVYTTIGTEMIEDRIITPRKLFAGTVTNRLLGSKTIGADLEFMTVNHDLLDDNIISLSKMRSDSVDTPQIINGAITREKLAHAALISDFHIIDSSVTRDKLRDRAVDGIKLALKSVTTNHLEDEIVLPKHATVPSSADYQRRALRNTILSPNAPTAEDGQDGDIWFQYI